MYKSPDGFEAGLVAASKLMGIEFCRLVDLVVEEPASGWGDPRRGRIMFWEYSDGREMKHVTIDLLQNVIPTHRFNRSSTCLL